MTGAISPDIYAGLDFLKGSDIPANQSEVTFRLIQFVVPKKQVSALTAEISETFGKHYWGLNATAIKTLRGFGYSDFQQLCGKAIVCSIGLQPNPQQNGALVRSLFVTKVTE